MDWTYGTKCLMGNLWTKCPKRNMIINGDIAFGLNRRRSSDIVDRRCK
jgi:hypothetical protein